MATLTWGEKWGKLADLCNKISVQINRSDSDLVAEMQDAIEQCSPAELTQAYQALSNRQREHFLFIATVVLHPQSLIDVVKMTVLNEILAERNAVIEQQRAENANLRSHVLGMGKSIDGYQIRLRRIARLAEGEEA